MQIESKFFELKSDYHFSDKLVLLHEDKGQRNWSGKTFFKIWRNVTSFVGLY